MLKKYIAKFAAPALIVDPCGFGSICASAHQFQARGK